MVDETLERRAGKKIAYKGWFRDAVRSTGNKVVVSLGIRWCVVCLLGEVPWSSRKWALPFLAVPVLSEKTCQRLSKPHRSGVWWTGFLMEKLRAWYPEREMVLVGDGGYACVELVACCQRLKVTLVSRLRLDAPLFGFPGVQPKSKRGPKPQKGERLRKLSSWFSDAKTVWCVVEVDWYGGQRRVLGYRSGVCLWYTEGHSPVPLRWVLVRFEEKHPRTGAVRVKSGAFFCSSPESSGVTAEWVLGGYTERWHIEEATFSDVLGAVRSPLWGCRNNAGSLSANETCLIPVALWRQVQEVLAYAA